MKTINNVQKTIARSAAVTAVLLFACVALNAQHLDYEMVAWNKTVKKKAVLVTNKVSDDYVVIGEKAYSKAWLVEFMKTEADENLRVERWMLNDVAGKMTRSETSSTEATQANAGQRTENQTSAVADLSIFYEVARDEELYLEDWMFKSISQ